MFILNGIRCLTKVYKGKWIPCIKKSTANVQPSAHSYCSHWCICIWSECSTTTSWRFIRWNCCICITNLDGDITKVLDRKTRGPGLPMYIRKMAHLPLGTIVHYGNRPPGPSIHAVNTKHRTSTTSHCKVDCPVAALQLCCTVPVWGTQQSSGCFVSASCSKHRKRPYDWKRNSVHCKVFS